MFSMSQIVAHLVGDYILQNHWIAVNKTSNSWIALLHALLYLLKVNLYSYLKRILTLKKTYHPFPYSASTDCIVKMIKYKLI